MENVFWIMITILMCTVMLALVIMLIWWVCVRLERWFRRSKIEADWTYKRMETEQHHKHSAYVEQLEKKSLPLLEGEVVELGQWQGTPIIEYKDERKKRRVPSRKTKDEQI